VSGLLSEVAELPLKFKRGEPGTAGVMDGFVALAPGTENNDPPAEFEIRGVWLLAAFDGDDKALSEMAVADEGCCWSL
jgi:hypothetical protein